MRNSLLESLSLINASGMIIIAAIVLLLLSKRANAVLDHMFAANPTLEGSYGSYFASSAYSEFRPLRSEKNEQAYEQNRRIEVSVVLRDASVRGLIDEYMRGVDPAAAPTTPSP